MLFFAIFPIKEFLLPHPVWRLGQKSFIKFRKLFGQWSLTYSDQIGCIPSSSFPEIPHGDPLIEIVFTRRSKFLWIVQFTDFIKALYLPLVLVRYVNNAGTRPLWVTWKINITRLFLVIWGTFWHLRISYKWPIFSHTGKIRTGKYRYVKSLLFLLGLKYTVRASQLRTEIWRKLFRLKICNRGVLQVQ